MARDKGAIVKYGGGVLKVVEVSDAGIRPLLNRAGATNEAIDLGYILDTELSYEAEIEDITDETGAIVASNPGMENVKLTGLFLQSDAALIDFLRDNTSDYFYRLYYKMTRTNEMNGKTQELFGGICKLKPMIRVKAGDKKIPFEVTFLDNYEDIVLEADSGTGGADESPATIFGAASGETTIVANKYYKIVETTVA